MTHFLVNYCQMFSYGSFSIIASDLNYIIKLTDFIRYSQVNDLIVKLFLFL
jgi:hypothetical protein